MSVTIRRAVASDFAHARRMLGEAGLPIADLQPAHLAFAAEVGDEVIGAVGLEDFNDIGLLRSLVVAANARSAGLGRDLVAVLEDAARDRGIRELWLLTIDADAWFQRHGYDVRDRADAPDVIRGTTEFSDLCPADAVLMSKRL